MYKVFVSAHKPNKVSDKNKKDCTNYNASPDDDQAVGGPRIILITPLKLYDRMLFGIHIFYTKLF